MLCITANWAIPDGTIAAPPPRVRFERFWTGLRRSALQAGFRHDGRYRPIERIELVLAGDTFDFLLTSHWLGEARPWRRASRVQAVRQRVMEAAWLRGGEHLVELGTLFDRGIDVPVADRRGRPIVGSWTTVPLIVTLLAGDRDHGLDAGAVARERDFRVGAEWTNGDVVVRHGAELDPLGDFAGHVGPGAADTCGRNDRAPTLRESLIVELVSRFAMLLATVASSIDSRGSLIWGLAAASPLDMPGHLRGWLDRRLQRGMLDRRDEGLIIDAWAKAVEAWHRSARRMAPAVDVECDVVDDLAAYLGAMDGTDPSAWGTVRVVDLLDRLRTAVATGPIGPARLAVFGHLSAARITGGSGGARVVCLGPRSVQRCGAVERGTAVDVSWISPAPDPWERALPMLTLCEADEGTGRGMIVDTDGIPEPAEAGVSPRMVEAPSGAGWRIVDAA
jgi:hypothetical protein